MKLWELAAVTGMYLGPTMDEARVQEVWSDADRVKAEQIRRAKERQERQKSSG